MWLKISEDMMLKLTSLYSMAGKIGVILMLKEVYMVALDGNDNAGIRWHCTGRGEKPFVSFNKNRAEAEATKLRALGYRAAIMEVNPKHGTCFLDLKHF